MRLIRVTTAEQLTNGAMFLLTLRFGLGGCRRDKVTGVVLRRKEVAPDLLYLCTDHERLNGGHDRVARLAGTRFAWAMSIDTNGFTVGRYVASSGLCGIRLITRETPQT